MQRFLITDADVVALPNAMSHGEYIRQHGIDGIRVRRDGSRIGINLDALLDRTEEDVVAEVRAVFGSTIQIHWYA